MRSSRRELIVGIGAAVAVGAVSVLVPVSAASSTAVVLETVARAVAVGMPVAVGLVAWRRPPFERFGRLLVATGAAVLVVTLSLSDDAVLYSTGRVVNWGVEAALVYLILAFPSGGLAQRVDRALATAAALLVALLFLPTALLVEAYPTPAPWVSCSSDCPRNAFMAVAHEPRVIEQLVSPARVLLAIALFVAIIARLADRVRGATRLGRRTLTPVLAVAMGWALVLGVTLGVRLAWPGSALVEGMVWLIALTVPAMAVAFLIGLMRWWVYVGASLRRLAARLRSPLAPQELRSALADAFEDPSLEVVYRRAGGWVDGEGQTLATPAPGSGRCLTEVGNGDRIVGGLIHDAALRYERAFSDAAASSAALTLESHRLAADTDLLLREVHESRARIAASADNERRRIERDIHEGAQQRLLSLRITGQSRRATGPGPRGRDGRAARTGRRGRCRHRRGRVTRTRHLPLRPDRPRAGRGARRLRRATHRSPRRSSPNRGGATPRRSRTPCTSAAWRRCRTPQSTPATPRRSTSPLPSATTASVSTCTTTAPGSTSTPCRPASD